MGGEHVGRIAQKLYLAAQTLESTFDATLFGLNVIPIVGWFNCCPPLAGASSPRPTD